MNFLKSKISLKVFISYILLCLLSFAVGVIIYSEFQDYLRLQKNNAADQNKVFRVGHVLSLMYENESMARQAIQDGSQDSYNEYLAKNDQLSAGIDSLKILLHSKQQVQLLDSVKTLIAQKGENILALKTLKSANETNESIDNAIQRLNKMGTSTGKYTLNDFVPNPSSLYPETRKALEKYIANLNNTSSRNGNINRETVNSILNASTKILKELKQSSSDQLSSVSFQERKLIANDLMISRQIQRILSEVESDALQHAKKVNTSREIAMEKSQDVFAVASVIGAILVVLFTVIILNDFLKIQKFKKELELSNNYTKTLLKSREHLIKMVSHDLRSPLSNILGYSDLLKTATTKSKRDSYVDKIKGASSYMTRLVEDLLDYTKLDAGKIKPKKDDFNLAAVINEISQSVQQQHSNKPISLSVITDNALNRNIISDSHRIRQILNNLISNAFKYTEDGFVKVNASISDQDTFEKAVLITVKDSGVGIEKEKQELIFNEFTQIEESGITQNGFGLGLSITKKLVDILNGELTFTSQKNIGSIFSVKIPVELSETTVPESIFKNNKTVKLTKNKKSDLRAIVIEDDDPLRILIEEIFNTAGIKVKSFKNGDEALKAIESFPFDFITTDIQLPQMNGFDILEAIKNIDSYSGEPVIALTGRKDFDKEYYLSKGFSEVIFKPFTPETLLKTIKALFPVHKVKRSAATKPVSLNPANENYSIQTLERYITDTESLKNVLTIFIEDSHKNTELLTQYVIDKDIEGINETSHKMLGMFKQIEAYRVVPILSQLEATKTYEETILKNIVYILNKHINEIVEDIKLKIV
ncbi:response regulator [Zhouia spongiae]|uniref:histidine kinase n=1 Tax=Zhouia spongiae TaxID=2202721 RepID=A0ABY3YP18_9FLAO|nr:ATP-binding protein [Zhouia spongiae]UNY99514.1 response regulator [Zhouia spongiae]